MYRYFSSWANCEEGIVDVGVVGVVELLEITLGQRNAALGDLLLALDKFL